MKLNTKGNKTNILILLIRRTVLVFQNREINIHDFNTSFFCFKILKERPIFGELKHENNNCGVGEATEIIRQTILHPPSVLDHRLTSGRGIVRLRGGKKKETTIGNKKRVVGYNDPKIREDRKRTPINNNNKKDETYTQLRLRKTG